MGNQHHRCITSLVASEGDSSFCLKGCCWIWVRIGDLYTLGFRVKRVFERNRPPLQCVRLRRILLRRLHRWTLFLLLLLLLNPAYGQVPSLVIIVPLIHRLCPKQTLVRFCWTSREVKDLDRKDVDWFQPFHFLRIITQDPWIWIGETIKTTGNSREYSFEHPQGPEFYVTDIRSRWSFSTRKEFWIFSNLRCIIS